MFDTTSSKLRMNAQDRFLVTTAFLASFFVVPFASAQTKENGETIPTFGEQSTPSGNATQAPSAATPSPNSATPAAPKAPPPSNLDAAGAPAPGAAAPNGNSSTGNAVVSPSSTPTNPSVDSPALVAAPPAAAGTSKEVASAPNSGSTEKSKWVRDGFYLRFGTGPSFSSFRGDGPFGAASISGLGGNSITAIGGSIAEGLVLAGTINAVQVVGEFKGGPYRNLTVASGKTQLNLTEKASASMAQFGALLDWYPSRQMGLHVGLGAGLGMVAVVNQIDDSSYYGTNGFATLLAGYDWPIAPTWALGLSLFGSASTKSSLKHAKTGADAPFDLSQYSIGIATSVLYF